MRPLHIIFILLINVIWALNIVAQKEAVTYIAPILSVALRYSVVLLVCATYLRPVPGRTGFILLTGLITGALQFGLGALSYHVTTNLSALAIAGQLGVPLSLILAVLIDGERIHWKRTLGIVLAIGGVMMLVFDPQIADERLGILLAIGASVCWGAGNLLFKRLSGIPILNLYAWQALVSIPVLLLVSIYFEPGALVALNDAPLIAFGWLLYSGIFASLVGHAGISWLVQRYPVTLITPFTLLTPLLAVAIATIVYGTAITPMMWVGGVLTLAGVAIITLRTASHSVKGQARE